MEISSRKGTIKRYILDWKLVRENGSQTSVIVGVGSAVKNNTFQVRRVQTAFMSD